MGFNWSTFFLEIINFLVLVWLIKHFFYKPVCEIIDKRRAAIDEEISSAKILESDAKRMKEQYENRLIAWEEEKLQQQTQLNQALEEQKKQQLILLEKQIAEENQKNTSIQDKQLQILQQKNERQALDQGISFTAKLLQKLTSQELENKLVDLFLTNIANFSPEQKKSIENIHFDEKLDVLVTTAYPLSQTYKENIQNSIQSLIEHRANCKYKVDSGIIAGLRVNIGSYVMRANLADELAFFSDSANGY